MPWIPAGIEPVRHRDYTPGDDYRQVDWKLCARTDELLTRQCSVGPDRRVVVFLDCSRSMSLGHPSKFQLAQQVVAIVGAAVLGRSDQLRVVAFSDRIVSELLPSRERSRLPRLVRFLDGLAAHGPATDLVGPVWAVVRRRERSGLALVVGDGFAPGSYERGLLILKRRGYRPVLIRLHDPLDASPRFLGEVELCDAESGACWTTRITQKDLRRFDALFKEHQRRLADFCRRHGVAYQEVGNDMTWDRLVYLMTGLRVAPGP